MRRHTNFNYKWLYRSFLILCPFCINVYRYSCKALGAKHLQTFKLFMLRQVRVNKTANMISGDNPLICHIGARIMTCMNCSLVMIICHFNFALSFSPWELYNNAQLTISTQFVPNQIMMKFHLEKWLMQYVLVLIYFD